MEWFILIFLLPLIVVPIVLLCGFAGCGIDNVATKVFPPPSNLVGTAVGEKRIDLTWQDNTGGGVDFSIERAPNGGSFFPIGDTTSQPTKTVFTDQDPLIPLIPRLLEGTTFLYQVRVKNSAPPSPPITQTTLPAAPSNLAAIAVDETQVKLSWHNNSTTARKFTLQFRATSGGLGTWAEIFTGAETTFTHKGLLPGTSNDYRVAAITKGFTHHFEPIDVQSVWSDTASATTGIAITPFKIAYDEGSLTADAPFGPNETLVQRIPAANLQNSGARVRITLAKTTTDLVIDKITLSQVKPGGKAYDSANDLKEVTSGGGKSGVSLKAVDPPKVLDEIVYNLDQKNDLLITFHIPGDSFSCREKTVIGARMFHKPNTSEADKPAAFNRAVGYATALGPTPPGTGGVYLVRTIEVA